MKKIILLLIIPFISFSQNLDYENNVESVRICTAIKGSNFSTKKSADEALNKILKSIGVAKRFVIQPCTNINNAVALSYKGVRYIMYDPEFMSMLSYSNDWANMFILAHEVGHHVNGHSIDIILAANDVVEQVSLFQQRMQELEADEFAGFVLGRLGAPFSDIESVFKEMSDSDDTYSTHPKRSKRINSARKGYQDSGGKVESNNLKNKLSVKSKYSNKEYLDVEYTILSNYYPDARYEGTVGKNGVPFGIGKQIMNNGDIYEGEMVGGKRNGYGVLTSSIGDISEGDWVNNAFTGYGIIKFISGAKHIGNWVNFNLANGKKQFANGSILEGIYKGRLIMKGLYYEKADSEPVEVGFLDGSFGDGKATYTYKNGNTIKSTFKDARLSKGVNFLWSGSVSNYYKQVEKVVESLYSPLLYEACAGRMYSRKKCIEYIEIPGKLVYLEFKGESGNVKSFRGYGPEGSFDFFGKILGYGEIEYATNSIENTYKGMFWDGKKNGYGILTYKDGRVESGVFKDNEFIKSEKFDFKKMQSIMKRF